MKKDKVLLIIDKLYELYPDATCELDYTSVYELLIATVLSAQCTDKAVNKVTKELFKIANTPETMVELGIEKITTSIRKLGLSKSKGKYLFNLSLNLLENFDGVVPTEVKDLVKLSGVGRKTANVVRCEGFKIPSVPVDTHVRRLANRLGFSKTEDVLKIEKDIMRLVPKDKWILSHHMFIFHGRRVCKAQNPDCEVCNVTDLCKYYNHR